MKRILIAAALICGVAATALANNDWTYETDDGHVATHNQVARASAACASNFNGPIYAPTWISCMRAQGYIVHICTSGMWWNGLCESGFLQGLH
jgi:hypothetical protein